MTSTTLPAMKPWIANLHAYVPGKAKVDGVPVLAKLSSNENPFGPSPAAVAAMQAAVADGHRYPDPASTALRAALAAKHGLVADNIICGTGSDEILYIAASAFAGPGDEIAFFRHAFAAYDGATRRVGATPVVVADRDYTGDVDAMLAAITPNTRLVFVANPNNPTGTLLPATEIRRLHAGLPADCLFVLDCAYAEFVEADYEDGFRLAETHANVLVTRTFSKIYGLAAQRVGWGYAAPGVIDALNRVRGAFNVTSTAQAGALAALSDDAHIAMVRAENKRLREWLFAEISALGNFGLRPIPSATNFILVEFPEAGAVTAAACNDALLGQGIICRYLAVQAMPNTLRISIGTESETRAVAAALRRFCETAG